MISPVTNTNSLTAKIVQIADSHSMQMTSKRALHNVGVVDQAVHAKQTKQDDGLTQRLHQIYNKSHINPQPVEQSNHLGSNQNIRKPQATSNRITGNVGSVGALRSLPQSFHLNINAIDQTTKQTETPRCQLGNGTNGTSQLWNQPTLVQSIIAHSQYNTSQSQPTQQYDVHQLQQMMSTMTMVSSYTSDGQNGQSNHSVHLQSNNSNQQQLVQYLQRLQQFSQQNQYQNHYRNHHQQQHAVPTTSIVFNALSQRRHPNGHYPTNSQMPSCLDSSDRHLFDSFLAELQQTQYQSDVHFSQHIAQCTGRQQFQYSQQRWANEFREAQQKRKLFSGTCSNTPPLDAVSSIRDDIRLSIGGYITSPNTGKQYINLGEAFETLQGFLYYAAEFEDSIMNHTLRSLQNDSNSKNTTNYQEPQGLPPFPALIARLSEQPQLAIKYYHKDSCDHRRSLSGKPIGENAINEMVLTYSVYNNAVMNPELNQPLFQWLPSPSKNVVRCTDYWKSPENDKYLMVLEYANSGEILSVVSRLHDTMNLKKKNTVDAIKRIQDPQQRRANIDHYRNSLALKKEGESAYIEFVRFMFQQMVQSVATLHNQGVAHLDISLENFVAHFDNDGRFLVKLIDFGRAQKMKKKANGQNQKDEKSPKWKYETFDFSVNTFPSKIRYTSKEAALLLKYQDAVPHDASREDVYALGVALYTMLAGVMPWDSPFYIEADIPNPECFGYLNGSKHHKIDIRTMTDVRSGIPIPEDILDSNFKQYQTAQGVVSGVVSNCFQDYFTRDALDLICRVFERKISLKEMAQHPFVSKPPNPTEMAKSVQLLAAMKRDDQSKDRLHFQQRARTMKDIDDSRFSVNAALMVLDHREKSRRIGSESPKRRLSDSFVVDNQSDNESIYEEKNQIYSTPMGEHSLFDHDPEAVAYPSLSPTSDWSMFQSPKEEFVVLSL